MDLMSVHTAEEQELFLTYNIMKNDQYNKLVDTRLAINNKIETGLASQQELNAHAYTELNLLMVCKQKIKDESEKDVVDVDLVDTSVLYILCNRIIIIFNCMRSMFPIKPDYLMDYINFCQHNVKYLYGGDQLDGLVSAVMGVNDLECWVKLLTIFITSKLRSFEYVYKIFLLGVHFLKDRSMPLWELMLDYLKMVQSNNMMTKNDEIEIAPKIQCGYLEWTVQVHGLKSARTLFRRLTDMLPRYQLLYTSLMNIEMSQKKQNYNKIRQLHFDLCTEFGRNNKRIWLKFIRFEFAHGTQSTVINTYKKAIAILHPDFIDDMIEAFRLLKIEYGMEFDGPTVVVINVNKGSTNKAST